MTFWQKRKGEREKDKEISNSGRIIPSLTYSMVGKWDMVQYVQYSIMYIILVLSLESVFITGILKHIALLIYFLEIDYKISLINISIYILRLRCEH